MVQEEDLTPHRSCAPQGTETLRLKRTIAATALNNAGAPLLLRGWKWPSPGRTLARGSPQGVGGMGGIMGDLKEEAGVNKKKTENKLSELISCF